MHPHRIPAKALEDAPVPPKLKLAALWTAFMFLYIYVDYFHLYMPGSLADMLAGKVFVFEITQGFLLGALISMTLPAVMIFLSLALPARANRVTNLLMAGLYIPYSLFNLVGDWPWMHMIWGAAVEGVLLGLVIVYAWKWPRTET